MNNLKKIIEFHFKTVCLDNELSVLELDIIDSDDSLYSKKNISNISDFNIPQWWDKDSKKFIQDFEKNKDYPIEKFSTWKDLTVQYLDSHSFIFPSLSNKAYAYYLAFFLWTYASNKYELFNSRNYLLFWIYTFNPLIKDTLNYDQTIINKLKFLTENQFKLTRLVITIMNNDLEFPKMEKELIENAYYEFWYSVIYKDLDNYIA